MRRVLLVGATGAFGSRLAALLARQPDLHLILAARRRAPLDALRKSLGAHADVSVALLDRERPDLAGLAPWLVVDAAGPFQGGDYALARAALSAGAHYIDLADARDFVAGFSAALDDAARAAGALAVAGASSTPALSHAALTPLVAGWRAIDSVAVTIAPGARAPRGLSVMQAILGYVGRPVRVFVDGGWRSRPGWSQTRRRDMPGLGPRLASLCETPDLDLLPARFPIRRAALFLAGLELPVMHLGLALLAWPVRLGLVRSLRPLARPLRRAADLLAPLGTDRGGMTVEADGLGPDGARIRASWALWAEAGSGPNVPAAPAAALVRALADGRETRRGAQVAAGLFDLDAILREVAHLPIVTATHEGAPDDPVLFRRLLGRAFEALPQPVRETHGGMSRVFTGEVIARIGRGLAARALQRVLGLPTPGRHAAEVRMVADAAGETWTRRFGRQVFVSRLEDTPALACFVERVGPVSFRFRLDATSAGVRWRFRGWTVFGLPLPRSLGPRVQAGAGAAAAGTGSRSSSCTPGSACSSPTGAGLARVIDRPLPG